MTERHTTRYPLGPLWTEIGSTNQSELARRTGVPRRTVQRWVAGGGVTNRSADVVATRLGVHPMLLWPAEWGAWQSRAERDSARHRAKRLALAMERARRVS